MKFGDFIEQNSYFSYMHTDDIIKTVVELVIWSMLMNHPTLKGNSIKTHWESMSFTLLLLNNETSSSNSPSTNSRLCRKLHKQHRISPEHFPVLCQVQPQWVPFHQLTVSKEICLIQDRTQGQQSFCMDPAQQVELKKILKNPHANKTTTEEKLK